MKQDLVGGQIIRGTWSSRQVTIGNSVLSPSRSLKLVNHSPDGFNWGYGGSGPAQLALALLLHYFKREFALANYQGFKWDKIAPLPQADFEMPVREIYDWANKIEMTEIR